MKIVATILALVIIGLLGASYYVFTEAGSFTKKLMEEVIPEVTGTPFSVESVDIAFLQGGASVSGFKIGNPAGYQSEEAFAFDQVSVGVDLKSILTDLIVVDQVLIANPRINYEKTLRGSNIKEIQQAVEKFVGTSTNPSTEEAPVDGEAPAAVKKIAIQEFIFEEGTITASIPTGDTVELKLPSFTISDLGTDGTGVTGEELIKEVLSRISAAVLAQTKDIGANAIKDALSNPENAKQIIEDTLKKGGSDSINSLKEGFGGLLNRK